MLSCLTINSLDSMSQFIEMFGAVESTKPLTDFIEVSFPGEWGQEDKDGSGVKVTVS